MSLTPAQYDYLLQPLRASRVQLDGKKMKHLQAWDVRRELIRAFGVGNFDVETVGIHLVAQVENNGRWTVVYRADVRLRVRSREGRELAHYEDSATGTANNQPSLGDAHDLALKTALSQGLKRCAVNLGDLFGLALYNKGYQPGDAAVRGTVAPPEGYEAPAVQAEQDKPVEGDENGADEVDPSIPVEDVVFASNLVLGMIQDAESKADLTVAWKEMKAAEARGDLTKHAVELLSEQWQARKEYLLSEGKMT